jgi:transcriptional regulator with XRE-family HTH domain
VTTFAEKENPSFPKTGLDLVLFGQRLKHVRRARGMTLTELSERVGRAPSVLSLIENGRREPKLSLIEALATALGVPADELMRHEPPSRRAQLEIALEEAQRDPIYTRLGLPYLRPGPRVPSEVLEHVLALFDELRKQQVKPTATPEEARIANTDLRRMMRDRDNYFAEIERAAARALAPVSYTGGALSQGLLLSVACTRRARSSCRRSGISCSATALRWTSPTSCASGSRPITLPLPSWCPRRRP